MDESTGDAEGMGELGEQSDDGEESLPLLFGDDGKPFGKQLDGEEANATAASPAAPAA